jgi:polar amino acid transport system substrate-binding protein
MVPKNNEHSKQRLEIFNLQLLKFEQTDRYQAYFDALDNGVYQPTNKALAG